MTIRPGEFFAFVVLLVLLVAGLGMAGVDPLVIAGVTGIASLALWVGLKRRGGRMQQVQRADAALRDQLPIGHGQLLLRQLPAPLLLIGTAGQISFTNPAAHTLLSRPEDGAHFSTLIRAPAFSQGVAQVFADGAARQVEFEVQRGGVKHLEARLSLLPEIPGVAPQLMALIEDRTRERLSAQARSDFVANASHELRTPLTSILGFIETLLGSAKDDPKAAARFLGIMADQAGRMERLISDLMSLSRIEMSENEVPTGMVDLGLLVGQAVAALQPQAAGHGAALAGSVAAGPQVPGDRDQLYQVLVNLIENGLKYAGQGRHVEVKDAPPDPSYPRMRGIRVSDDGPGIARAHLPRLTERFFRTDPAASRQSGGTGLGLAICKHILNRHKGALQITSVPGAGSEFTFWLPQGPGVESADPKPQ